MTIGLWTAMTGMSKCCFQYVRITHPIFINWANTQLSGEYAAASLMYGKSGSTCSSNTAQIYLQIFFCIKRNCIMRMQHVKASYVLHQYSLYRNKSTEEVVDVNILVKCVLTLAKTSPGRGRSKPRVKSGEFHKP